MAAATSSAILVFLSAFISVPVSPAPQISLNDIEYLGAGSSQLAGVDPNNVAGGIREDGGAIIFQGKSTTRQRQLCPNVPEHELAEFFYFKRKKMCFRAGAMSDACEGANMDFGPIQPNDVFGSCSCSPPLGHSTPFIYNEGSGQCYAIYTQANCPPHQWLVFNEGNGKPTCAANPCESKKEPESMLIYFNGRCVGLHQGVAECATDYMVGFEGDDLSPSCIFAESFYASGALNGKRKCPAGTRSSFNGKCLKSFHW